MVKDMLLIKIMKKIISIILAIALTVLTIGTNVLAESEQISLNGYLIYNNKSHGIKWTYDRSKTLTITNIPKEDVSKYPTKQFSDEKMEKYVEERCPLGCKFFILKKLKNKS